MDFRFLKGMKTAADLKKEKEDGRNQNTFHYGDIGLWFPDGIVRRGNEA